MDWSRASLTVDDVKTLVDGWVAELGQEPDRYGYQFVYSEGWKQALVAVMGKMDTWRRTINNAKESKSA